MERGNLVYIDTFATPASAMTTTTRERIDLTNAGGKRAAARALAVAALKRL